MRCAVRHRHGSDLMLLWLWCRLAAVAPIGPLAWELPYAAGAALKKKKQNKTKKPPQTTDVWVDCKGIFPNKDDILSDLGNSI